MSSSAVAQVALLDDPDRLVAGLSRLRLRLLDALAVPASATELAHRLDLTRQKVNYHLRVLESAGLVELAEVRQRRGFTERVMRRSATAFVVDPSVLPAAADSPVRSRDRHAAEHLIATASDVVREVARMQAAADERDQRLLTFTIETELAFTHPSDVHDFTDALAEAVAEVTKRFHEPSGRRYRLVVGGHPAPDRNPTSPPATAKESS
ncbi:MAG: transcriptional regulator, ArsR family [Marmoricola sp.]|nr:transcriptional regulator, ArsR family [Marmoricola sp.]